MNGVVWAGSIWSVVLLAVWTRDQKRPLSERILSRENLAIVIALLGTHSIVGGTDAEEILRDPVAAERVLRGFLAGLAILMVTPKLISRLWKPRSGGHRGLAALTMYTGVALISTIYSAASVVSAAKAVELFAGLAAVSCIALGGDALSRLKRTVNLLVLLEGGLLTVAVGGFFLLPGTFAALLPRPGFISEMTMGSPYAHPNALSSMGALVGAYGLACFFESRGLGPRRLMWLAIVGVGLLGTTLSSGRQGVVIWIASALVLFVLERRRTLIFGIIPLIVFTISAYGATIWQALLRSRPTTLGTLTGRTVWWGAALEAWRDHPWTGWGYGVGGRFVALRSIGRGATSNVHSGYFEALVGIGVLGVLPLLYALGRASVWAARSLRRRLDVPIAVLMIPLILRTGVAQGFGGWLNFELVLFMSLVAIADRSWIAAREVTRPQVTATELHLVGAGRLAVPR
jgi:O-antigen ligase